MRLDRPLDFPGFRGLALLVAVGPTLGLGRGRFTESELAPDRGPEVHLPAWRWGCALPASGLAVVRRVGKGVPSHRMGLPFRAAFHRLAACCWQSGEWDGENWMKKQCLLGEVENGEEDFYAGPYCPQLRLSRSLQVQEIITERQRNNSLGPVSASLTAEKPQSQVMALLRQTTVILQIRVVHQDFKLLASTPGKPH
ncbi:uncharacterized protein LOC144367671 [Ictidomys tridecemlineatus]